MRDIPLVLCERRSDDGRCLEFAASFLHLRRLVRSI